MAWTYVSKAVVAALHTVSAATLQDEWSTWAEALIAEFMGYNTIGTTETVTAEAHNGDGTSLLYVKYPPISSVTTLSIGTVSPSAVSSSSYKVFSDHIELLNSPTTELSMAMSNQSFFFPVGVQNITITYVSGLATVPAIVQFTAAEMIAEISKYSQRGGADGSIKYTGARTTLGEEQGVAARRGLSATLQSIMKNNLRRRVAPLG